MNAVFQQVLRSGWFPDGPLTPESSRELPSGNRMPLLGLGTLKLTHHTVATICHAFEAGFRMVDTAPEYHTQRGIGDAIRACGIDRHDIFVITKIEPNDDAYAAIHRALGQLKLGYVDLVLINSAPTQDSGEL